MKEFDRNKSRSLSMMNCNDGESSRSSTQTPTGPSELVIMLTKQNADQEKMITQLCKQVETMQKQVEMQNKIIEERAQKMEELLRITAILKNKNPEILNKIIEEVSAPEKKKGKRKKAAKTEESSGTESEAPKVSDAN